MAKNLLQQHFPMIRVRQEVEERIYHNRKLRAVFEAWTAEQRKEFLDFCTGERGVKILYDSFFKEVFNPEYAPERLEELLSLIMKQKVKILQVIPNDSTRIADESSLLVTDIVVELADHSIANVEIQKIGYMFPGQRSACYSADLLLRQYKRVRSKMKKFSYKYIKNTYTIIFFERSTKEFHDFPEEYLHSFAQKSDTGLELDLLQKYYFVPLDIFRENIHNKSTKTKLDAWLIFLTSDSPEMIMELIEEFPEFKCMYEDIYELCRNIEGVMQMFSKELQELDRNTVQYMIDTMQDEIDASKKKLDKQKKQLSEQEQQLSEQEQQLSEQEQQLTEQKQQLAAQENQLIESRIRIENQQRAERLYALLVSEGRLEALGRAVNDEAYREQLFAEYQL